MAERGKSFGGGYKFGFNNQEKEADIGEYYSFEYRIHDARLGRFLSVDPLAPEYPWNSTYAFAENRVIDGIDLEGLEWQPINASGENCTQEAAVDYKWVGYEFKDGKWQGLAGSVGNATIEKDGKRFEFTSLIETGFISINTDPCLTSCTLQYIQPYLGTSETKLKGGLKVSEINQDGTGNELYTISMDETAGFFNEEYGVVSTTGWLYKNELKGLFTWSNSICGQSTDNNYWDITGTISLETFNEHKKLISSIEWNKEPGLEQFTLDFDLLTLGIGKYIVSKLTAQMLLKSSSKEIVEEVAAKTGAKLSTNGIKLAKQLASEAQMAEKGITVIGPGKLKEASRLAQQYGGNASEWVKKSSSSYTKNGTTFETHWYENISTGVRAEFKTKIP